MMQPPARDRFLELLRAAVRGGTFEKLTLGKPVSADTALKNIFVRPVALKSGPHLAFVWRYATRDVTKNHPPESGLSEIERLIGTHFLDAHLFTTTATAQLELQPDSTGRLKVKQSAPASASPPASTQTAHDRTKTRLIAADAPWLRALGVTNERGQPREGMSDKFRQIQKFAELLAHLLDEAWPAGASETQTAGPLRVVDMGSGKGYLTFTVAALLGPRARVAGIELRRELVDLCNRVAQETGLSDRLSFSGGSIAQAALEACDVLIALHACDTATDDALARGIAAGARLLVVSPCCQKELRPQLIPPPVLAEPLRHGIFQERQAEFITDALRAQLLEWAGFRTKVFEFISTEHTAKNLMIAATRARPAGTADDERARGIREFARFYGIRRQRLAEALGFDLRPDEAVTQFTD